MIPNIVHFVFGLSNKSEYFFYVYYLAILTAKMVNNPQIIYFHYHHEPYGYWWEEAKKIILPNKIDIPTHFGNILIHKTAHRADKVRLEKLLEKGGIYLDIDTVCCKSWLHLLNNNNVVLGRQDNVGICNAIIMSEPNSYFLYYWYNTYVKVFKSDGWDEASVVYPGQLIKYPKFESTVKIMPSDTFFEPQFYNIDKIFVNNYDIPKNLIALHLWETCSIDHIKKIDPQWLINNKNTLYSKIVRQALGSDLINEHVTKIKKLQ